MLNNKKQMIRHVVLMAPLCMAMVLGYVQPVSASGIPSCVTWRPGATGTVINVSNAAAFKQAMAKAKSGQTIRLAPGNYGRVELNNVKPTGNVTVTSANPASPAVFNYLRITNAANLTLSGLRFNFVDKNTLNKTPPMLDIYTSASVKVVNNSFVGRTIKAGDADAKPVISQVRGGKMQQNVVNMVGLGAGGGMNMISSRNMLVSGNTFDNLTIGFNINYSNDSQVVGNTFRRISFDSMDISGLENFLIEGNWVDCMKGSPDLGHRDLIQLREFSKSSKNLRIKGNVMSSCQPVTHGIGMFEDGKARFHQNIQVLGNTIVLRHPHGIALGASHGVTVVGNTLARDCATNASDANPMISIGNKSTSVTITGNKTIKARAVNTAGYTTVGTPSAWKVSGNSATACMNPPKLAKAPGCGQ